MLFAISLAGVIAIIIVISQTTAFKQYLRDRLQDEANARIAGKLAIESIEGNLVSNFYLKNLLISTSGDTALYLPGLTVEFLPTRLFQREISFRVVSVQAPYVKLIQTADSSWNLAALVAANAPDSIGKTSELNWRLVLHDVRVAAARVKIQPVAEDSRLPAEIARLNLRMSLAYSRNSMDITLAQLSLATVTPDLHIRKLAFRLRMQEQSIHLADLRMQTAKSRFTGEATVNFGRRLSGDFDLFARPLDIAEFQPIFQNINIAGAPAIELHGGFVDDSVRFEARADAAGQKIVLAGTARRLADFPEFELQAELQNVNSAYWLLDTPFATNLSGELTLTGKGRDPGSLQAVLQARLSNCKVAETRVDEGKLTVAFGNEVLQGGATLHCPFGTFVLRGKVSEIVKRPRFEVSATVHGFDAATFLPGDSLRSDVNAAMTIAGSGSGLEDFSADLRYSMRPSTIAGARIDTAFCLAVLNPESCTVDSLYLQSQLGRFYLAGKMSLASQNDLRFFGELGDMRWVGNRVGADTLFAQGDFSGRVFGAADSLQGEVEYRLRNFNFNLISLQAMEGELTLMRRRGELSGEAFLESNGIQLAALPLDTASVRTTFAGDEARLSLAFARDDLVYGEAATAIRLDSLIQIRLDQAEIHLLDQVWRGGGRQSRITLRPDDSYVLENLCLRSGEQSIEAQGVLSLAGKVNLNLQMRNVGLAGMAALAEIPSKVGGKLNVTAQLSETASSPELRGEFDIEQGNLADFTFARWTGHFSYNEERLSWDYKLQREDNTSLQGEGFLPVNLAFDYEGERIFMDRPIRFQTDTQNLPIALVEAFVPGIKNVAGRFVCDIKIENTLSRPEPVGRLRIINGAVEVPEIGGKYRDLQVALTVDPTKINISQFDMRAGAGIMRLRGYATFGDAGLTAGIQSSDLELSADNFQITAHEDYQAAVSGKVHVSGDLEDARFNGEVTVLRANFYLPAFEESRYFDEAATKPLLMTARKDSLRGAPGAPAAGPDAAGYIDNLRGNLTLRFPRNTWLRDPEINVEIDGTLDLVKTGPDFELFRTIRVVRGTYNLYGARFDIVRGIFRFSGGIEFNPEVDIEAVYVFRAVDKTKRKLRLQISEKLFSPKLKFWLDDMAVEETDAISYVLFKRSFEDLTQGERSQLARQSGGVGVGTAKSLLAGLVASQLQRSIGRELNLDVIEFQSENDWRQAIIVLGKYITNDLFVSYQREIKIGQTDEVVPDQVILEYEITPFLFLQATKGDRKSTGFDLIWKYER